MPRWALAIVAVLVLVVFALAMKSCTGGDTPAPRGPWLSFLVPGESRCTWKRLDVVDGVEVTLASFHVDCDVLNFKWAPSGKKVLIEQTTGWGMKRWLGGRSGELVSLRDPPGYLQGPRWNGDELVAVTMGVTQTVELEREILPEAVAETLLGPAPGASAPLREWRVVGTEWMVVSSASLPIYSCSHCRTPDFQVWIDARLPREPRWSQAFLARTIPLVDADNARVSKTAGRATWVALATSGGRIFVEQNGMHGKLAFDLASGIERAKGLSSVPEISTVVENEGAFVLIAGASAGDWPRLYDASSGALVWSSDDAVGAALRSE